MTKTSTPPTSPSLGLLMKIGSVLVHTDEMLASDGHDLDRQAVISLLSDPEVQQWVKDMGALLPLKRQQPYHGVDGAVSASPYGEG